MVELNVVPVLRSPLAHEPWSLPAALESLSREIGGSDVVLYLVDFGQTTLEPLGDYSTHADLAHAEPVATTMAGRAFVSEAPVSVERDGGTRLWVPVYEGSDRTGVLAVTVSDEHPATIAAFQDLARFVGYLVTSHARVSDSFNLHRRRKAMTLAASMQWDLLPPLLFSSSRVSLAALLEPAYEVGGDCFDYAANAPVLDLAIMDSMGHGLSSAILAGLAMGCYRHDRRHGRTLEVMHENLALTVESSAQAEGGFVTGQLAQVNMQTGGLRWTNAGHPLPLHVRNGKVIGQLACEPTLPWGLGSVRAAPAVAAVPLEPNDRVLFYTDGVIDSKKTSPEGRFDLDRLVDLVGQTASDQRSPAQVVRDLVRAILAHHDQRLVDDATLVMVEWPGPDAPP
jgi:serine phosphatase RsbU (regulator of sigma subunit)